MWANKDDKKTDRGDEDEGSESRQVHDSLRVGWYFYDIGDDIKFVLIEWDK